MDPYQEDEEVVGGMESPPEWISTSDSLEMEMGSGGLQVKQPSAAEGSKDQVKTGNLEGMEDQTVLELERLIKDLHVKGDPQGQAMKVESLSKLEHARAKTADCGKADRRLKWKEEVRTEMLKREEFKRQMASTPLKKVTDWKVKADMSKMSMEWRKAFKKGRTNFLIYEVIPILFDYCITPDSKGKAIVTCRPVSRDWKNSAEACILSKFQPGAQQPRFRDIQICAPHLLLTSEVNRFNYWSEQCYKGANPFFARKVVIAGVESEWRNNLEFWKGGEALLRRWGQEIWVYKLRFDNGMTFEAMYELLVKYLKLMPNLRCLVIFDFPESTGANSMLVTSMLKDLGKDIYGPLKACMARNPLPELPHLKQIQLQNYVIPPIAKAMFDKYGRLEDVFLRGPESGEDPHPMESLAQMGHPLPHLKFLTICSFARPETFDLSRNCPSLEKFFLKELYVESPADVLVAFQNLNLLKPISSLRHLSLAIQPTVWGPVLKLSDEQLKGLCLELPQLEFFHLNAIHVNLKNIDFLLPCAGLKELDLVYQKYKIKNKPKEEKQKSASAGAKKNTKSKESPPLDEIIHFFQYINRLYESNLWKLFPELRMVKIKTTTSVVNWDNLGTVYQPDQQLVKCQTKVYRREGYKQHLDCTGRPTN